MYQVWYTPTCTYYMYIFLPDRTTFIYYSRHTAYKGTRKRNKGLNFTKSYLFDFRPPTTPFLMVKRVVRSTYDGDFLKSERMKE